MGGLCGQKWACVLSGSQQSFTCLSPICGRKYRLDRVVDRYKYALNDFHGPDNANRTDAGGLKVGVGDALKDIEGNKRTTRTI